MFSSQALALEFKAGTYFFDNSKLKFDSVKCVVEDTTTGTSNVYKMTKLEGKDWWCLELNQKIENINCYCFFQGGIAPGTYSVSPEMLLTSCEHRTRLLPVSPGMLPGWVSPGWVFYPINDSIISDGYWRTATSYDASPSMTLPVVHITTQNNRPVTSRDYYMGGTLWIEDEQNSLGTQQLPLDIEIKGRGNWTWRTFNKKPYKIKFATKQSPLGLDHSKHFILKPDAGDYSSYMRDETGFELSRQLGMPYTPRQLPVEVVFNGEYEGLYFLCEKIRVEGGRVDIIEQEDNDSSINNVSGGWLLEMAYEDNYVIAQYENEDPANNWFQFVSQSPEILSQEQRTYIHDFIHRTDSCIFTPDKNDDSWEHLLDINTVVKFYVIHEVMENIEAFQGSLFMYKDWGLDEKLKFGPVWDFGNSVNQGYAIDGTRFIFDYETPFHFVWIKELLKFPHFQSVLRGEWKKFVDNNVFDNVLNHIMLWKSSFAQAEQCDKQRWGYYASGHTDKFLTTITRKVAWLDEQWSVAAGDVNCDGHVSAVDATAIYNYLLNGDETYKSTCDIDGDGHITSTDITALYNILLGE